MMRLIIWVKGVLDVVCNYTPYNIGSNSSISRLPEEALIEVLSRVPAKSLLVCKAVCSSWYRLINDVRFNEMHLERAPHVILGVVSPVSDKSWLLIDDTKGLELASPPSEPRTILFSCNGLLLFQDNESRYVVCNLVTREEIAFQLWFRDIICGFYFHEFEKEYKLLIYNNSYYTYGLETKDKRTLGNSVKFVDRICDVAACGALFWKEVSRNNYNGLLVSIENIVMFDLITENFVVKPQPENIYKRGGRIDVKLLKIEGKLGCCDVYAESIQVWSLEDVENWKWVKKYVVDCGLHIIPSKTANFGGCLRESRITIIGVQNGIMLLFQNEVGFLHYDLRLNRISEVDILDNDLRMDLCRPYLCVTGMHHVNSLVSVKRCVTLPE